jgi:hypothetical protein
MKSVARKPQEGNLARDRWDRPLSDGIRCLGFDVRVRPEEPKLTHENNNEPTPPTYKEMMFAASSIPPESIYRTSGNNQGQWIMLVEDAVVTIRNTEDCAFGDFVFIFNDDSRNVGTPPSTPGSAASSATPSPDITLCDTHSDRLAIVDV